ncbi:glycosyltransferase family 2 protein [Nonomuraea sp. LPB2021202275-12-8]|uniref:glycosyltransferase family 2 protein n=1 Tax=Nonomuraea sp. LPB2021202275-12-8 TaxID=3120159 RepID=UPI00300D002D
MIPLLSIIVPIYNVEPYLAECLKSLAAQTLEDFEVIMVDDGSLDGSRRLAEDFACRDARFVLLDQPHQGPGPARNLGVRHASAPYLAFADADDVVPPGAYDLLVGSLQETGSDLACGAVLRIEDGEPGPSSLHEKVFRRRVLCTHIMDRRSLVRDRTVWNKVYRTDFWRRRRLEFPAGIYEDVPVAMRAHVLATSVDVLDDVVYHWRRRDSGEVSITQRRTELSNLAERLAAIRSVRAFLDDTAPELLDTFDGLVLEKDILFLFQALESGVDAGPVLDLARQWVAELSPAARAAAPSLRRLELHLVQRGLIKQLCRVRNFRRASPEGTRIVPRGWRETKWYGDYPYFRNRRLAIPDEVYDAQAELKLLATVDECEWTGQEFLLRGQVAIHRVKRRLDKLNVWLTDGSQKVPLEVKRAGKWGFVATVDPRRLQGGGPTWKLQTRVEIRGLVFKGGFRDGEKNGAWRLSVAGWSRRGMDIPQ